MLRDNNKKRRIVVVGKGGGGGIAQVQSDWAQTDNTQVDYIKNKPAIKSEWFGTQAEYDLIDPKDPSTIYYIEDANGSVVHNNKTYGIKVKFENPELTDVQITTNGTYQHTGYYGYDEVEVNVQPNLTTLNATSNDTYTPTAPVQGYSSVTVNVQPNLTTLNATTNDTYTPTSPYEGYSEVTVNVPAPQLTTLNTTMNGDFTPSSPYVGYSSVRVGVIPTLQNKTVTQNGQVTADAGYDGLGTVTVSVAIPEEPFYVEDISGLPNTLNITMVDNTCPTIEVYKSTDGTNWTSMGTTAVGTPLTASIDPFGKLYLKATANKWSGTEWEAANTIGCTDIFGVGGNIMSLLVGDNYTNATLSNSNTEAFKFLFAVTSNNVIRETGKLKLPSNTVSGCYNRMFCYCSLNTVPELPATTLAPDCYQGMFQYGGTKASPVLPAETLDSGCYAYMFYGCSDIKGIVTYAQDISATDCTSGWLDDVGGTGDFYNLGGATYSSDASGIPSGWTEHNSL